MFESVSGPLAAQPFASQIYGLYTGFVYLTPILGGWLADHGLGRRRTITLGAGLMVAGHFLMAYEPAFLFALALIARGLRRLQAEYLHSGRRALHARRRAARPRLFDLLSRHQHRRLSRAARLRNARRDGRLGLWLRRRGRRHGDRASHLSRRPLEAAARPAASERRGAATPSELRRAVFALVLALSALGPVLGRLRAAGQHASRSLRRRSPIEASDSSAGARKFRSPGFRPSIR